MHPARGAHPSAWTGEGHAARALRLFARSAKCSSGESAAGATEHARPKSCNRTQAMCLVPLLCCAAVTHGGSVFRPQLRPDTESCRTPYTVLRPCRRCRSMRQLHPRATGQPAAQPSPAAQRWSVLPAQATANPPTRPGRLSSKQTFTSYPARSRWLTRQLRHIIGPSARASQLPHRS